MALAPRLVVLLALFVQGLASAATVKTEISGVEGELLANVRASVSLVQAEQLDDLALWRLRQMAADAREETRMALRPFGFYSPSIRVRLTEPEGDDSAGARG